METTLKVLFIDTVTGYDKVEGRAGSGTATGGRTRIGGKKSTKASTNPSSLSPREF